MSPPANTPTTHGRPRTVRGATVLVAVLAVVGALCAPAAAPALGQERGDQAVRAPVVIDVDTGAGWFGPAQPLSLSIRLTSTSRDELADLRVTVALHDRARSRSRLEQLYSTGPPRSPLEAFTYRTRNLPPRGSETIGVLQPLESLRSFQGAADGVYPLSVTVRRLGGAQLSSVVTGVAFVTTTPAEPLRLAAAIVVAPTPLLDPRGAPVSGAAGRLEALTRALEGVRSVGGPAGLAVNPGLLRDLDALGATQHADAAGRLLSALRDQATRRDLALLPHTYAQLPHLAEVGDEDIVASSLRRGREQTHRALGVAPTDVLYPPGLAIDRGSLESALDGGAKAAFVAGSVTASSSRGLTPAEPVSYRGVSLIPSDASLRRRLTRDASALELARAIADTAMIYFESPARRRALAVTFPLAPGRDTIQMAFLSAVPGLPWLGVVPADELTEPQSRSVSVSLPSATSPPRAYLRAVADARAAVSRLRALALEDNPASASFVAAFDAALGTAWWTSDWDDGVSFVRAITRAEHDVEQRITASVSGPVTFTSRRGQVPISIRNDTGFPVRVRVEIRSPKLRFPEGSARTIASLEPPGELITFPALADATGTFPLTVRLSSADGTVLLDENELTVRSTAFNLVALALTIGAAAFIVVWYVWQLVRRRRRPDPELPAPQLQELSAER